MGNRLLLADDSITIQKVVAIIFANEEFELTVVDNGTAALEKAREVKPDVMLVDALMPGKTGYEVCAEIRRDPVLGAVPILLLIGAFEPLDEEKARECGADATVSKPFESQQLIDRVKEMLELGKTRKTAPPMAQTAASQPAAANPAAEEIWGDLSSLDAMAPAAPAAAAPVAVAPAVPEAVAPAEDIWADVGMESEPAWESPTPEPAWEMPAVQAQPAAAAVAQPEPVEASTEDDLWGAFELEEETPANAEAPSELFGVVEPEEELETEFEAEEIFSFDESEEIEETGPALELEEPAAVDSALTVGEEEFFAFSGEEKAAPAAPVQVEAGQPEYEPFEFEAEEPAPVAVATPAAPAAAPQPVAAAAPQAAAPQAAPQAAPAASVPELTEDQLVAALSKVSREVIERIVWEVVPDLAEMIIKEEIRKLKSGVRS